MLYEPNPDRTSKSCFFTLFWYIHLMIIVIPCSILVGVSFAIVVLVFQSSHWNSTPLRDSLVTLVFEIGCLAIGLVILLRPLLMYRAVTVVFEVLAAFFSVVAGGILIEWFRNNSGCPNLLALLEIPPSIERNFCEMWLFVAWLSFLMALAWLFQASSHGYGALVDREVRMRHQAIRAERDRRLAAMLNTDRFPQPTTPSPAQRADPNPYGEGSSTGATRGRTSIIRSPITPSPLTVELSKPVLRIPRLVKRKPADITVPAPKKTVSVISSEATAEDFATHRIQSKPISYTSIVTGGGRPSSVSTSRRSTFLTPFGYGSERPRSEIPDRTRISSMKEVIDHRGAISLKIPGVCLEELGPDEGAKPEEDSSQPGPSRRSFGLPRQRPRSAPGGVRARKSPSPPREPENEASEGSGEES